MTFRFHITAAAAADMDAIDVDLLVYAPRQAEAIRTSIENAIRSLVEFPHRYALAPEAAIHGKQVRQLVVGKYRIVYMVVMETVNIVRVRHTAQAPLKADELN